MYLASSAFFLLYLFFKIRFVDNWCAPWKDASWYDSYIVNSLRPNDAIWQLRSGLILAQVMDCWLTAPSHGLNQCWLIIRGILWHSAMNNFTVSALVTILYNEFERAVFKITATSRRGPWVNKTIVRTSDRTRKFAIKSVLCQGKT